MCKDQSFWDDIEEGPRPLVLFGYEIVMCFASEGRYLSRHLLRVINEIIAKAVAAFPSTGIDPYSVLSEDDWFNEICQEAIERLSGKPKAIMGDGDLNNPTASVSAQSMSSVRSHGNS